MGAAQGDQSTCKGVLCATADCPDKTNGSEMHKEAWVILKIEQEKKGVDPL